MSESSPLSSPRGLSRSSISSLQSPPPERRQVLRTMTNEESVNQLQDTSIKADAMSPSKQIVPVSGKFVELDNSGQSMTENPNSASTESMCDDISNFNDRFGYILNRTPQVHLERLQIGLESVVCLTPTVPPLMPRHFLRCHSGADAPPLCDLKAAATDTSTAVTCCRLEPDGCEGIGGEMGARVACCGGRVVSILHVATGTLVRRFTDPLVEQRFTALAWSRLVCGQRRMTILAVAGKGGTIALFHPDFLTRYCRFEVVSREEQQRRRGRVTRLLNVRAMQFDSEQPCWLYCAVDYGGGYGEVRVWHVGKPGPPPEGYSQARPRLLLTVETEDRLPLCLAVSSQCLAVGTDCELFLWRVKRDGGDDRLVFDMTCGFDTSDDEGAVNALAWLPGGSRLAVHFSGLNRILVWRVADLLDPGLEDPFSARPLCLPHVGVDGSELRLSDGLSCCGSAGEDHCWLVCGAAEGGAAVFRVGADRARLQQLLRWPDSGTEAATVLHDSHLSRADKLPLQAAGIRVLSTAAGATCRHLLLTTDINMVCIWSSDVSDSCSTG